MAFFETLIKIQKAPRRTRKAIVGIATFFFALIIAGVWWLEWQNLEASDYTAAKNQIMGPLELLWKSFYGN
ncbi:MAG: hypothetical protein HY006_00010 [Candidatus Sungbacteria bacterium]|nr:hypothetical protein [Candidatus Sungbacteria bacterium]